MSGALAAAQALAETQVDAIVCSPLKRCQHTAQAIAASVRPAYPDGTEGDVFTEDLIESYLQYKNEHEIAPSRLRPTPLEFEMYYDC